MNPMVVRNKAPETIDYKGTVWWCKCGFTKPRYERDRVQEVMGGGVKCVCGEKMKVVDGTKVVHDPVRDSFDLIAKEPYFA